MACYNAAPYIEQAITSATKQSYTELELIVVDDASIDASVALAKKAARSDSRISSQFASIANVPFRSNMESHGTCRPGSWPVIPFARQG